MALTPAERKRGWVEYHCPDHGFLVAGPTTLVVRCGEKTGRLRRCRKRAKRVTA